MKRMMKNTIGCVVTIGLAVALLWYSTDLMERKESDVKNAPFFEQEEDYDVLLFGTSRMGYGVYPMELWNDYGIVSYNLAGHGNPMATTYWTMVNAFDHTTPKLVVIDCYLINYMTKTHDSFSSVHLSFDAFPLSRNKIAATWDLLDDDETESRASSQEPRTRLEVVWDYAIYHSRWNDLGEGDFVEQFSKEKGAEHYARVTPAAKTEKIPAESKLEEETVSIQYLRKMIEECQDRNIDVLLTFLPSAADEISQQEANRVYDIAEQYGVNYINFLEEEVVNYATDYCDKECHLNMSGARKTTDYIGQYITEHYDIPDQRDNTAYAKWYTDYEEYQNSLRDELRGLESLDKYLMMLSDENYTAVIEIHSAEIWENDMYLNLLANLNVDCDHIDDDIDLLIIQEAGKKVEQFDNFFGTGEGTTTLLGKLELLTGEEENYKVYRNGEIFYEVASEQNPDADIRIVVLDKDTMEIVDHTYFMFQSEFSK